MPRSPKDPADRSLRPQSRSRWPLGCGSGGDSTTAATNTDSAVSGIDVALPASERPLASRPWRPAFAQSARHLRGRPGRKAGPGGPGLPGQGLRPQQREQHGQRHRPPHLQGDRRIPGGCAPAARDPVLGSEDTIEVSNDEGNSLTPIDPRSGTAGQAVPVTDPYNLYFTPGGRHGDRRGRAPAAPRLPRRPHDATHAFPAGPVSRSGSPRLHRRAGVSFSLRASSAAAWSWST